MKTSIASMILTTTLALPAFAGGPIEPIPEPTPVVVAPMPVPEPLAPLAHDVPEEPEPDPTFDDEVGEDASLEEMPATLAPPAPGGAASGLAPRPVVVAATMAATLVRIGPGPDMTDCFA